MDKTISNYLVLADLKRDRDPQSLNRDPRRGHYDRQHMSRIREHIYDRDRHRRYKYDQDDKYPLLIRKLDHQRIEHSHYKRHRQKRPGYRRRGLSSERRPLRGSARKIHIRRSKDRAQRHRYYKQYIAA